MNNIPVMLTIKETALKFTGLREHAIRKLINSGKFSVVRCGKKILINEQVLIRFLNGECCNEQPIAESGRIRKIS